MSALRFILFLWHAIRRSAAHRLDVVLPRPGLAVVVTGVLLLNGCRMVNPPVRSAIEKSRRAYARIPEEDSPTPRQLTPGAEAAEELLPAGEMSLQQARSIAVDHNPDIDAAYSRLLSSRAVIDEARARFLPTVSFTHNSTRTFHVPANRNRLATSLLPSQPIPADISSPDFPVTTILNALTRPLFGGSTPGGDSSSFSEHSTALTASWVVFDGFVRDAEALSAKAGYRAADASLSDVRRLLVRAVDAAYFQVQLALERIHIAEADEEFSRKQFEETQKLRKAGRATQADVDNFRVRMLDAQTRLANATGAKQTGRVVLAELLGVHNAMLPDVVTLSPLRRESEEDLAVPDPEEWIENALNSRPDIRQLSHILEQSRQRLKASEGLYLPIVSVSGSWGYDKSSNISYEVDDQSSAASLEFRWDIYTGGARKAKVQIARSLVNESIAQLKRFSLAVQSEVRQAVIDVVDAQQRIRLQRESLETARENRRIVQAGYVAGKETLNRLNEAQRDFVAAQANLAQARIGLRQAWSDLQAAAAMNYSDAAHFGDHADP